MAAWRAEGRPPRLSCAVAAGASLLLNAGTAVVLWSYHRSDMIDGDEADGVLTFASIAIAQACTIESVVAFVGLVGALQRNAHLVRFFARASLLDLGGTFVLLLSTILLTATQSLAGPFSELVCRELTRGELFRATSEREGRAGGTSEGWGMQGVDVVAWGVETCEESWRMGMVIGIALLAGLLVFKAWGIWATSELHSALVGGRSVDPEWCEDKAAAAKPGARTRALSMGKPTRSRSAPTTYEGRPHSHGRHKSNSVSHRPRLVLVPVFFEGVPGPRTISPSSYSPPTTPTSTSFAAATTTSTDSLSPPREPRHPRRYSAPPPPSPPRTVSPPALPTSPSLYPTTPLALDDVELYLIDSPAASRRSQPHSSSTSSSRRSTDSETHHEKQV